MTDILSKYGQNMSYTTYSPTIYMTLAFFFLRNRHARTLHPLELEQVCDSQSIDCNGNVIACYPRQSDRRWVSSELLTWHTIHIWRLKCFCEELTTLKFPYCEKAQAADISHFGDPSQWNLQVAATPNKHLSPKPIQNYPVTKLWAKLII